MSNSMKFLEDMGDKGIGYSALISNSLIGNIKVIKSDISNTYSESREKYGLIRSSLLSTIPIFEFPLNVGRQVIHSGINGVNETFSYGLNRFYELMIEPFLDVDVDDE